MCNGKQISFTIPVNDAGVLRAMINMLEEVMAGIPKKNVFGLGQEQVFDTSGVKTDEQGFLIPVPETVVDMNTGEVFDGAQLTIPGVSQGIANPFQPPSPSGFSGEFIPTPPTQPIVQISGNDVIGQPAVQNVLQSPSVMNQELGPRPPTERIQTPFNLRIDQPSPMPPTVELDCRGLPWDARIHSSSRKKNQTGEWKNMRGADPVVVKQVEEELKALMSGTALFEQTGIPEPIINVTGSLPNQAPQPTYDPAFVEPSAKEGETITVHPNTYVAPPLVIEAVEVPIPPVQPVLDDVERQQVAAAGPGSIITAPPIPFAPVPLPTPEPSVLVVPPPTPPLAAPLAPPEGYTGPLTFPDFLKVVTGKVSIEKVITYKEVTDVCQQHGVKTLPLLNSARPDLIPTVFLQLEELWNSRTAG